MNDPGSAKAHYKKKEKLAKLRQLMMLLMMLIAGLYYVIIEQGQGIQTVVTERSRSAVHEEADEKYAITSFLPMETGKGKENKEENAGTLMTEESMTAVQPSAADAEPRTAESHEDLKLESVENSLGEGENRMPAAASQPSAGGSRINLNTATLEELDALPGVGPSTAQNIITYRESYGGFAAPEEIMNVKRIGEKTYEKLKDYITVY